MICATGFLRSLGANCWAMAASACLAVTAVRPQSARNPRLPLMTLDVIIGKPHPQCYELAARKFGVNVKECLVFDEAAAGILADRAADVRVIVVVETHFHPIELGCTTIPAYEGQVAH
jgi:sugar-phosphatase